MGQEEDDQYLIVLVILLLAHAGRRMVRSHNEAGQVLVVRPVNDPEPGPWPQGSIGRTYDIEPQNVYIRSL